MMTLFVALVTIWLSDAGQKQDRLIGLLTLPQVFGEGPCTAFEPRPIALFARPRAQKPIAHIQVDKYWVFHDNGGCGNLEVRVHEPGRTAEPVPTEEIEYEAQAAIVVARDREWFRIRTSRGPLWLRGAADNTYVSLLELLGPDALPYMTADWDGSSYASPGGSRVRWPAIEPQQGVRVLGSKRLTADLWLFVETTAHCSGSDDPKRPTYRGWVRAYGRRGPPAVWFSSRGC